MLRDAFVGILSAISEDFEGYQCQLRKFSRTKEKTKVEIIKQWLALVIYGYRLLKRWESYLQTLMENKEHVLGKLKNMF